MATKFKMNPINIKSGIRVKTNQVLGSTAGMIITEDLIRNRTTSRVATVYDYVPGHGGDVWWLAHDSKNSEANFEIEECSGLKVYKRIYIAPYMFDEFEEIVEK